MNYNFKGRGIFVFSDPAGANAVHSIVKLLVNTHEWQDDKYLIITNETGIYPLELTPYLKKLTKADEILFDEFKPDFLFSATSINDFEHNWRKIAQTKKITSYSFIDHWCNYFERFQFNNEIVFPDEVWVINEQASTEAIEAGIPNSLIKITGNPYYQFISTYRPNKKRTEFFSEIGIDSDLKIILFISDDIRIAYKHPNIANKSSIGFDEYSVVEDMLESFNELSSLSDIDLSEFIFVLKIHPRCSLNIYDYLLITDITLPIKIKIVKDCDPLLLNYYSDFVTGMYSNMVIEAFLMEKKILRVQTGQLMEDMYKHESKTIIPIVQDKTCLTSELKKFIS